MARLLPIFGAVSVLAMAQPGHAFNNGASVVGHSGATGPVCNDCHSGGTAPGVALTGPTTLAAGATGQYSFTITSKATTDKIGGTDIAVSSSGAQLTAGSTTVQAVGGEIVHKAAIPLANGAITVQFSLKAPSTGGPLTLYASGLCGDAVDVPLGKRSSSTTLAIMVTGGAPGTPDAGTGTPNPGTDGGHAVVWDLGTAPPPTQSTSPTAPGESDPPPAMTGGCSVAPGSATAAVVTSPPALVMLMLAAIGWRHHRRRKVG
jgi:MYXO-CTERM domain-containing protein